MSLGAGGASGKVEAGVFHAEKRGQRSPSLSKKPTRPLVYSSWSARSLQIPDGKIGSPVALGMPQIDQHRLTSAFHPATRDPVLTFV